MATATTLIKAVEKELTHYPGVRAEIVNGGKHNRMVFALGDQSRFLTIPKTPSGYRGPKNAVRDFRKTMKELGAQRIDVLPGQTRGRRTYDSLARISLNGKSVSVTIDGKHRLIDRFKTKRNEATGWWALEFRASPDLEAPPLLVLKSVAPPPGGKLLTGAIRGFYQANTNGWRLSFSRKLFPRLAKTVDSIRSTDIALVEEKETELVFKLPTGLLPTSYAPRAKAPMPQVDEAPAQPEAAPPTAIEPQPAPAPTTGLQDRPMILQFPKQAISIEQAIAVLNKAKASKGNNLRFTITEGGFLTAVHRIGH